MQSLQRLHETSSDKDLAILGFNCADDRRIACDFLHENSIVFPSVLDSSTGAETLMRRGYGNRLQQTPVNYIIDRDGRVAAAWLGFEQDDRRGIETLAALGLDVAP